MSNRLVILAAAMLAMLLPGCVSRQNDPSDVIRIGYQKWGSFSILKTSGELTKSFEPRGIRIEWIEFPSGPPLLEALNAGSIDIGHAGDSPPIFAQAAEIPFVYFAASSPSPDSSGLLVKNESTINGANDLRGRRVGFAKGTSAHTMILRYLEKHEMKITDIVAMYLSPADGRVALESGSIDAWAVWDPYLAAAEQAGGHRKLATGKGYVEGREFYFASRRMAESHPERLTEFRAELARIKSWAKERPDEVNRFLSAETGIPMNAVGLAESRRSRYDTHDINEDMIAAQQSLADRYLELGLLPRKIAIRDAVLKRPAVGKE
ncbi:aliphatic sulfonate ABC transporter substrate-binding protein [Zavarzinella formosa]|uniref:aliphatic sulfonate ABC transporter substrate-binding protein n=1 Tax=Zavarzinella formosa TaxID=360055 RepID=UPI000360589F|nr:aliphatic sulfonate ABC transporter substrate-binding protein [Zavarzinella formosa]